MVVTREFIDYISTRPLQVEVFGHYQHHPQHQSTAQLPRFGQGQITLSTSVQVMRIESYILTFSVVHGLNTTFSGPEMLSRWYVHLRARVAVERRRSVKRKE